MQFSAAVTYNMFVTLGLITAVPVSGGTYYNLSKLKTPRPHLNHPKGLQSQLQLGDFVTIYYFKLQYKLSAHVHIVYVYNYGSR